MITNDPDLIRLLEKLNGYLSEKGIETYIIGGFVRDMLLGRQIADVDLAVKADAQETAAGFAELLHGKHVPLDEENGIARVVVTSDSEESFGRYATVDFSAYEKNIRNDLARRDFSINAMAIKLSDYTKDFKSVEILDPFEGQQAISEKLVDGVNQNIFLLDPVRLLRAVRFSFQLGFAIESMTETLMRENGHMLFTVAGERLREELMRLLALPDAGKIVKYLDDLDYLTAIIPEMEEMRGVPQPKEHYWDVLDHSKATVEALEFVLGEGEWPYVEADIGQYIPISDEIQAYLDTEVSGVSTRRSLLKLAALLHDIGKPETQAFDENGRMRFLGHGPKGADLVIERLEALRFSTKEIKILETEIVHHMRPTQMSQEGMPTDRAIYRYFRDTGETGVDIFFLNLADHLATRGPELDLQGWQEHTALIDYVIRKKNEKENIINPTQLLDGYDIMSYFGLDSGPKIGEILEALREAQASGDVKDREEALSFIRKIIQTGDFPDEGKDGN